MFASFDNDSRVELTHYVFNELRQASLNCNTDIYQIAGIATVAGDLIEAHGNPKDSDLLTAPRVATIAGTGGTGNGSVEQCRLAVTLWLQDQLK